MRGYLKIIEEREESIGRDLVVSWILCILAVLMLTGWGVW
jgi:hypothetical protein